MTRRLISFIVSIIILSNVFTEIAQAMFYIKLNAGASALNKVKIKGSSLELNNVEVKGDLSSTVKNVDGAFIGLGIGIDVIEDFRCDVTFEKFLKSNSKGTAEAHFLSKGKIDVANKIENDIRMLMFNSFIDFYETSIIKFFVGGGVGISRIESKLKIDYSTSTDLTSILGKSAPSSISYEVAQKYNLAFAGYLGASAELLPKVVIELIYSYRDIGKSRKIDEINQSIDSKGHSLIAGLRYGI